mgnify:CR=1 FL=1
MDYGFVSEAEFDAWHDSLPPRTRLIELLKYKDKLVDRREKALDRWEAELVRREKVEMAVLLAVLLLLILLLIFS